MKNQIHIFTGITFIIGLLSFTMPLGAQQVSLSIEPPIHEVQAKPGANFTLPIRITNQSDPSTIIFYPVLIEETGLMGDMRILDLPVGVTITSNTDDLPLNKPLFLKPQEQKDLSLSISLPKNLPEKDYHFAFVAESIASPTLEGTTTTRVKASIASHMLIQVSNKTPVEKYGTISLLAVKSRFSLPTDKGTLFIVDKRDTIPLYLNVENTSDAYVKTSGEIRITQNKSGQTHIIESYAIPQHIIFSHRQRLLQAPSSICSPEKYGDLCKNTPTAILSLKKVGGYDITSLLSIEQNPISQTISILVLPVWELLAFFFTIFALLIIFLVLRYTKK